MNIQKTFIQAEGLSVMSRPAKDALAKGHAVLGAQASSPARVPPNQQPLTELVALDTARTPALPGPRGLFCKSP
jgi:hypothetical protein